MNEVQITMLGTTGSGKTTFMLAMYDEMSIGFNGFTFSCPDFDLDRELRDEWEAILEPSGADRWPKGTIEGRTYGFSFNYAFNPIMSFSWYDYAGADIYTNGADMNSALQARLNDSNVVLICVPCDQLVGGNATRRSLRNIKVGEINRMLSELARERGQSRPVVIVVFTKSDLYAKYFMETNKGHNDPEIGIRQELEAFTRGAFSPLFAPKDGWTVLLCPVTLGSALAMNSDTGEIDPQNMHVPLMFTFLEFARELADSRQHGIASAEADLGRLGSWWSTIFRTGIRAKATQRRDTLAAQLSEIKDRVALVAREIPADAQVFRNGEKSDVAWL